MTFPNTESTTQKKQGLVADRVDFVLRLRDKEISFCEVTGYSQKNDEAKDGVDLWRLVRFGNSVLHEGSLMVHLLQVVYDDAMLYRLFPYIRGVMVLAEDGAFTIPTHVRAIGALQASLPVLVWHKVVLNRNDRVLGKP
ncbi:hypothetical protein BGZ96_007568 [Linnemannia gamsii]|uniref:Uncharacterized protein n=1 Tax=Linnemannia gamsii TaxID=64522 RepID=A0ABQ7K003_9FUNG|nr:hypothetical protein BGZ96_007568 [Linnemannia gamsii]